MWHQTDLKPKDFQEWFEKDKLGKLFFPVGKAYIPNGRYFEHGEIVNFFIALNDLFELCTEWKINGQSVPTNQILAIIAFGSAVGPQYKTQISRRKKYFLFGEEIQVTKQKEIQPNDADFLIITKQNMIEEKFLKPLTIDTYDCGTWIRKGGIHLVNRGRDQVVQGFGNGDTISINALNLGVPIFFTSDYRLIRTELDLPEPQVPWKLWWNRNKQGLLTGDIR